MLVSSKSVLCIFQEARTAENSLPSSKTFTAMFYLWIVLIVHLQNYLFWCPEHAPGNAVLKAISWNGCGFPISCLPNFTQRPRSPSLQVVALLFVSAKAWKMLRRVSAQLLLFPTLILRPTMMERLYFFSCSHIFLVLWGFFWDVKKLSKSLSTNSHLYSEETGQAKAVLWRDAMCKHRGRGQLESLHGLIASWGKRGEVLLAHKNLNGEERSCQNNLGRRRTPKCKSRCQSKQCGVAVKHLPVTRAVGARPQQPQQEQALRKVK